METDQFNRYVCSYENCTASFSRPSRLKWHVRVHSGERPFICTYHDCNKSYTRAEHLKRHERIHTEDGFKCGVDKCHSILTSVTTLMKHMRAIHVEKPNLHSTKRFKKYKQLEAHQDIKPYICPKEGCGKAFRVPSKLKRHSKHHEGYSCDRAGCNKHFDKWTLFRKHMKVAHAKVHVCTICSKEFNKKSNYLDHQGVHETNRQAFICPNAGCYRYYFHERNLRHHIKSYHDKRPFNCSHEGCYLGFKTEALRKKHMREHDPNIPLHSKKRKKNQKIHSAASMLSGFIGTPEEEARLLSDETEELFTNHSLLNGECGNINGTSSAESEAILSRS